MFINHFNISPEYPDQIDRRVFAMGVGLISENWELAYHSHEKGQLIFVEQGVASLEAKDGIWNVPFQGAVWIPPGVEHRSIISENSKGLVLFIDPESCEGLPVDCSTMSISALLREILQKVATFPELYDEAGSEGRLIDVLLDELHVAPLGQLNLPLPTDSRLKKLTDQIIKSPGQRETLKTWAKSINMSERNMSRLFSEETGMSVNQWRRQLHVVHAVFMLAEDRSLQEITENLGYESTSSFITMFRKIVGVSPKRFITERREMEHQQPFHIPSGGFYEYE
ncbi:MAG TPA: helix-turn-helix transcriptional regulator [Candidatus Ignatzschineria merdigallinarum]|uniref:Helix-turn-helix transcriptional regulator n=1 Tax=Candidatus Ignatzschineria merdigallinarum TaxID=2838621 RepID=A0A9D1Q805_9GAMM|nr:helix-turn-helix transcriptional regulator [Candidatus Ignatzschineria merdigallinarum]